MLDLAVLQTELATDPLGLGYAALSDADAAALLNLENRPASSFFMSGNDLQNKVIAWTEVEALTTAKRDTLMAILRSESVDITSGSKTHSYLNSILGAQSKAALTGLQAPPISRAAELGLPVIGHPEVAEARAA